MLMLNLEIKRELKTIAKELGVTSVLSLRYKRSTASMPGDLDIDLLRFDQYNTLLYEKLFIDRKRGQDPFNCNNLVHIVVTVQRLASDIIGSTIHSPLDIELLITGEARITFGDSSQHLVVVTGIKETLRTDINTILKDIEDICKT